MDITTLQQRQALELRGYQIEAADRLDIGLQHHRRILIEAPTGSGKTVLACEVIRRHQVRGKRVLVLVHRRELVGQMSRRLHAAGLEHGIIAAGFPARPGEHIQVASIATLDARAMRSRQMELPEADLIVLDEAHHATADTWRRILDKYPDACVVGVTATPCRKSGTGLGGVFQELIHGPQVQDLIDAGFLVGTRVYGPASGPDMRGVRSRGGDWAESEVAARMDKPELVGDAVTEWHRHAEGKRTIVFATNIAHMMHLVSAFRASGVVAEGLDGSTPTEERDRILARLADGIVDVVVNVGVLTEGFDCPDVGCVMFLRPTKSFGLYRQMAGRGLRPAKDKLRCTIIDHAGLTAMHGFIEEPVDWSLDTTRRAESRSKTFAQTSTRRRELENCVECGAVYWRGQPCGACGRRPRPKAVPVDVCEGDLVELNRDRKTRSTEPTGADKANFYAQLLWIAHERGFQSGWAAHKHRERYGTWPASKFATPIEPRPETRSWVRSRFIAYARAKAGAA